MEVGSLVWVKNTQPVDKSRDDLWLPGELIDVDASDVQRCKWTVQSTVGKQIVM